MLTRGAAPRARRVWQWWTGGKDTVWALHVLRNDPVWDVRGLLAQVDQHSRRSVIHGLRKELLEQQAAAVGLPLRLVQFDSKGPSSEYEAALQRGLHELRQEGAEFVAFGELASSGYLDRRSSLLATTGLTAELPLWGRDPRQHVEAMLDAGVTAWVCAVNTMVLPANRAGRCFDSEFVAELPAHADPGGGNDEFHTFVEWAPGWSRRVSVRPGRRIEEYDFAFVDLEPVSPGAPWCYHRTRCVPSSTTLGLRVGPWCRPIPILRAVEKGSGLRRKTPRGGADDRYRREGRCDEVVELWTLLPAAGRGHVRLVVDPSARRTRLPVCCARATFQ